MTIALRLGKTMDEIEDITLEEYKEWVAYFDIVDGVDGDGDNHEHHTRRRDGGSGQRPQQSQSSNRRRS